MAEWEAPAKVNLDLRVGGLDRSGKHPLHSLVQTVDLADDLSVGEGDEDVLWVEGAELPEGGENLVWKAVSALGLTSRPPLRIELRKRIPVAAGLGGGSSNAAATLAAVGEMLKLDTAVVREAAVGVGSDVPLFLVGGTMVLEGYGEKVESAPPLDGFALALAVPQFELSTPEVYRRWDELGEPVGDELSGRALPPSLRPYGEIRNDLTPAALSLRPELGDWIDDLCARWERPVLMSGSGPSCFAFFLDRDEAEDALDAVVDARAAVATDLRPRGVARRSE